MGSALLGCVQTTQTQAPLPNTTTETQVGTQNTPSAAPTTVATETPATGEMRDCTDDVNCFGTATANCAKASYTITQASGMLSQTMYSEVRGFNQDGKCELYSKLTETLNDRQSQSEMTCLVPREALSGWNNAPDKRYCTGSLLKKYA